jgi:hypothetical protein
MVGLKKKLAIALVVVMAHASVQKTVTDAIAANK